ncbi:acyl-CoA Delta-9 desaturase-like [Chrysoperla carnea]|uniref:acyl-CoA Delta-9 desaturase-like n=1 Tax=Chrysoperla carnea TaxID=189513 RepID=UPI001D05D03A|nr:acyl-CoA Delta-9 desaturase-like [Chrysoperla carnea]
MTQLTDIEGTVDTTSCVDTSYNHHHHRNEIDDLVVVTDATSDNNNAIDANMNIKQRPNDDVHVTMATNNHHQQHLSGSTITKDVGEEMIVTKRQNYLNNKDNLLERNHIYDSAKQNNNEIINNIKTTTKFLENNNIEKDVDDDQFLAEEDTDLLTQDDDAQKHVDFVPKYRWPDLFGLVILHIAFVIAFILMFTTAKFYTTLWTFFLIYASGFGITAGAHRLWSHRAYKAKWPLKLILTFLFTISGQRDAYTWALDHRIHHKYSETTSDPHDATRGFWFAHIGWLVLTPHPNVVQKRLEVDMSDLEADPIVMWQRKLYLPLFMVIAVLMPVLVPFYYWNEQLWVSFLLSFAFRYAFTLNLAFFVNSAAHMWGNKPYDKFINPVENIYVSIAALGEGWHNYHHVFPWDYKTSELGTYTYNISTGFIDLFAKIGWAYDRKKVSREMIARRKARTGDGSHVWGYGDKDIAKEDLVELERMKE